MERVFVAEASGMEWAHMLSLLPKTRDGELFDADILHHQGTFVLKAFAPNKLKAYVPITQPLMMENLIFPEGLNDRDRAQAITRLAEHVIEEAIRRDSGEVYFLCRDAETCKFAEHHGFTDVATLSTPLKCYRFNLLEKLG